MSRYVTREELEKQPKAVLVTLLLQNIYCIQRADLEHARFEHEAGRYRARCRAAGERIEAAEKAREEATSMADHMRATALVYEAWEAQDKAWKAEDRFYKRADRKRRAASE